MKDREIKFRVWSLGKMYYSYPSADMLIRISGELELQDDVGENSGLTSLNPFAYTLMQYTGLKDKNGREIYEGDICLIWRHTMQDPPYQASIDDIRYIPGVFYGSSFLESEVIGNIYENPELLEQ